MTSLGSCSVLLQNGRGSWHRRSGGGSAFYASCRANGLDQIVGLWASRKTAEGGTFPGVSSSRVGEMGKCVHAVGKRGSRQAQMGGGDDDGEGVVEEVIKATIEKSKKVVAVQDDLRKQIFSQIAERKKLVSSIKASMVDSSKDVVSSSMSGGSLSEYNIGLTSGKFNGEDSGSTYSDSDSESYTTKISKTATLGSKGGSINETKELVDGSQVESLLSREIDSMATDSTTLPSLLPISIEPYATEDEKAEEFAAEAYEDILVEQIADSEEGNVVSPLAGPNVMNVILVAAECAPWSKTGGLGDVAGALPKALARRGHRVMVVVPLYGNYAEPEEVGVRKIYNIDGQDMEVTYYHAYIDGVDFIFLGSAIFHGRQNDIYGGQRMDILKRMVLLCKAAVEVPWFIPCGGTCYGDGNLVFIANDWHTALLPVYLKAYYRDNGLMKYTRSVLVIHNIAHQGRGPLDDFNFLNLPPHCLDLFKLYDPVCGEHLNIFAGGLKTADRVITVSHGYAWELKTEEGGWGLHNIITENDWKLQGIVNGIDTEGWNPELDVHLKSDGYTNYSLETLQTGKPQCKAALQREIHLPVRDVPLFGFIGRLDGQKGVDIIAEAIPWLVSQDAQLILLGTGRSDLEEMLRKLEGLYHDKVIGRVGFSVSLAHRITAGADALLMPSRFEPCGLNQLYAMRYGTIPVVHAVGGLRDTVKPFDPFTESGLGWTFDRAEVNGLIDAMRNCLNTYWNYKGSWEALQRRGMAQDLSWDSVAEHYEEILVAAKYQW